MQKNGFLMTRLISSLPTGVISKTFFVKMRLIVFLSVDFPCFKNPISTCRFGHILPSYQTLQLGAALGLTRFAIMLGILQHPLHMAAELPEDIVKRQVLYSRSATYFEPYMKKPAFCICENKDTDRLQGNRAADQCLCFHYTGRNVTLVPKSKISS